MGGRFTMRGPHFIIILGTGVVRHMISHILCNVRNSEFPGRPTICVDLDSYLDGDSSPGEEEYY